MYLLNLLCYNFLTNVNCFRTTDLISIKIVFDSIPQKAYHCRQIKPFCCYSVVENVLAKVAWHIPENYTVSEMMYLYERHCHVSSSYISVEFKIWLAFSISLKELRIQIYIGVGKTNSYPD